MILPASQRAAAAVFFNEVSLPAVVEVLLTDSSLLCMCLFVFSFITQVLPGTNVIWEKS